MNISAKRMEGETFEAYRVRRKAGNRLVKAYLRGRRVRYTRKELIAQAIGKNRKSEIQNPK